MSYTPLELATAFVQTGELADALEALNAHLATHPDDTNAARMRAEVLARLPDASSWRAACDALSALDSPTPDDYLRLSGLYRRLDALPQALDTLRIARATYPEHPRLTEQYVYLLEQTGDFPAAIAVLDTMSEGWRWQERRGDLLAQNGDLPAAIAAYTAALDHLHRQTDFTATHWATPIQARLYLARAAQHLTLGDYDAAATDYTAAAQHLPDDPTIPFYQAVVAFLASADDDAREIALRRCRDVLAGMRPALARTVRKDLPQFSPLCSLL